MQQFEKYSVTFDHSCEQTLCEVVSKKTDSGSETAYLRFLEEMLEQLNSHIVTITEKLLDGKKPSKITDFVPDLGDPHNGAKTTVLLILDTGRILYKPHDLTVDELTGNFVEKHFKGITRIPKVVCCGNGGFTEFISNMPASTPEEAASFYEHLGGTCVLFQLLGSCDLHGKNMLAEKTLPVPIDLETIIRPVLEQITPGRSDILNDVRRSLYFSGLMPHYLDSERSLLAATGVNAPFMPVVDGESQPVTKYWDRFLQGFRTTYRKIMGEKEAIRSELKLMGAVEVRYILRDTSEYCKLFAATEDDWIKNRGIAEELLFKILSKTYMAQGGETFIPLARVEAKAMVRGDYPYFYTKGNGHGIWSEGKELFPDFFGTNIVDACLDRLEAMSEEEMEFECALLTKAIIRSVKPLPQEKTAERALQETEGSCTTKNRDELPEQSLSPQECIAYAEKIICMLDQDKLVLPCGSPLWLTLNKKRTSAASFSGRGFVDGTLGIALFCAAVCRMSQKEDIKLRAGSLLNGILSTLEQHLQAKDRVQDMAAVTDISFATGYAGILFGLDRIACLTQGFRCHELCELILRQLSERRILSKNSDLMGGSAGLLKAICCSDYLWECSCSPGLVKQLAKDLLDKRIQGLWKLTVTQRPLSGMAHGQAGIASALRLAFERLSGLWQEGQNQEDAELLVQMKEAIEYAYNYESGIYSQQAGNWPDFRRAGKIGFMLGYCSGAPGIGWDALNQTGAQAQLNANRAMNAVKNGWKTITGDHLCCGKSASVEFLISAAQSGCFPEAGSICSEILRDFGERIDDGQLLHLGPAGFQNIFVPTLYYGVSGIGYEFLRFAAPNLVPSPFL